MKKLGWYNQFNQKTVFNQKNFKWGCHRAQILFDINSHLHPMERTNQKYFSCVSLKFWLSSLYNRSPSAHHFYIWWPMVKFGMEVGLNGAYLQDERERVEKVRAFGVFFLLEIISLILNLINGHNINRVLICSNLILTKATTKAFDHNTKRSHRKILHRF